MVAASFLIVYSSVFPGSCSAADTKNTTSSKQPIVMICIPADASSNEDGEYKFDASKIKDAHNWCQEETRRSLERGENTVVSNTFTSLWELKYYRHLAKELGVNLKVYKMTHIYGNIHDVPQATVERMIANIENPKNNYEGEILVEKED